MLVGKNLSIGLTKYSKIGALSAPNFQLYFKFQYFKKYYYFLRYLVFFWEKMGPKVKDQEVRGEVSNTFLEVS